VKSPDMLTRDSVNASYINKTPIQKSRLAKRRREQEEAHLYNVRNSNHCKITIS
jgi:hypothetical protein